MERTSARRGVGERGARRAIDDSPRGERSAQRARSEGVGRRWINRQHRGANIADKHRERPSNRTEKRPAHIEGKRW